MAIWVNTPAKNCFQKNCRLFTSSKKNTLLSLSSPIAAIIVPQSMPKLLAINQMQSTTETMRQKVFKENRRPFRTKGLIPER